jgi:hypothetical protein
MVDIDRVYVSSARFRNEASARAAAIQEAQEQADFYAEMSARETDAARGWTGTELSGGYFQGVDPGNNDKLSDAAWRGDGTDEQGIGEQMLTDPAVGSSVAEWIERALNADWTIQPGDPDDPAARMQAEFVRRMLWETAETGFNDQLRNFIKSIVWGCALAEPLFDRAASDETPTYELTKQGRLDIWRETDRYDTDHIVLTDIAPRLPKSIAQWLQDPVTGRFGGIEQYGRIDDTSIGNDSEIITIPADRLMLVTHAGDGSNWEGIGRFRAAYIPWEARKVLLRMGVITSERFGVGVPIAKQMQPSQDYDPAERKKNWADVKNLMKRYRGGSQGWMALPWGFDVSILDSALPAVKTIQDLYAALALEIHIIGNTQHLIQGTQAVGTYGLREGQASEFRATLNPLLEHIASVYNRTVIPKLIDLNWAGVRKYPKLTVGDQQQGSTKEDLETYAIGVSSGAVTPQLEDQAQFREQNNWPAMTEATQEAFAGAEQVPEPIEDDEPEPEPDDTNTTNAEEGCGCGGVVVFADGEGGDLEADVPPPRRIVLLAESRFDARTSRISREDAVARIAVATHEALGRSVDGYLDRIRPLLDSGDAVGIAKAAPPNRAPMTATLRTGLQDVRMLAHGEVKREFARQEDEGFERAIDDALADWRGDGGVDAFAENPSGVENAIDEIVRSPAKVTEGILLAASTTAEDLAQQANKVVNDYVQQTPVGEWDEDAIRARAGAVITPRTMAKDITQDVNGTYNVARAEEGRAEGAGVAVYTLQPEIGINGPHEPCAECVVAAESPNNPAVVGTPAELAMVAPNPDCLSTLSGVNTCWCAVIYLSTGSVEEAREAAGL